MPCPAQRVAGVFLFDDALQASDQQSRRARDQPEQREADHRGYRRQTESHQQHLGLTLFGVRLQRRGDFLLGAFGDLFEAQLLLRVEVVLGDAEEKCAAGGQGDGRDAVQRDRRDLDRQHHLRRRQVVDALCRAAGAGCRRGAEDARAKGDDRSEIMVKDGLAGERRLFRAGARRGADEEQAAGQPQPGQRCEELGAGANGVHDEIQTRKEVKKG